VDCVRILDIKDAEAFVVSTLLRSGIRFTPSEREELIAEGLAILCKLALDYEPMRNGHTSEGRFSGYASMYLPRKLTDAWHGLHPEHVSMRANGERGWTYNQMPVPFAGEDDPHQLCATSAVPHELHDQGDAIEAAMQLIPVYEHFELRPLLSDFLDGTPITDVALTFQMTHGRVVELRRMFGNALLKRDGTDEHRDRAA
jgi:hypothetical protein